ncbi:aminopeptidase [bacterium (Candidatus Blackallbacteria) CG17_big_fil_post_rev_8_21_14_2_50_48_46]|uniref:Aminopeptidase n=1 Tax=bacterium (Candidatus Blackallbacteria) CG17_big_fil_post_rev_8_21_14_2_50_48_46 TaxID=2014261 RepID=A0A2M7G4M9_9BACT|nr:MAG: aminopeptidase [bacterium (Candidatus Blackallbacteria) CG18_big_fil_WC_8_21_14_2_50_49_26]PIW16807.1 MAG: aminopeptidase [bacterium (Candidatus Blackallbacteria) CG17_big_fil_post_rev_8_21_14_2_50_48_46]PIW48004.1 MAG: aminopeptidase [bacterium (Candidatus Blackallbacteria) CG13_big_fil_rev_8_21_14_2_50_49_14]
MKIELEMIKEFNGRIHENDLNRLVMNAMGRVELNELAVNRDLIKSIDFSFSDELDVAPEATAQQKVGVCWIFAAMNLLRYFTQKKINVKSFEYSGPYLMFWDKFEKANYFLEKMIEFKERPYDDRELRHFLDQPLPDGGDWYMFVNLVKKYGMVPASVMQHAAYSKDSTIHNQVIASKLRQYAAEIRKMANQGSSLEEIQAERKKFIEELYRIMVVCFGTPPESFNWSYKNEDKAFFRETNITPHQFFEKYVNMDLDEYVCLWSSPMQDTPYEQVYSVAHTRKMVGGQKHLALNLPFDDFKAYALKKLKNHEPVLFSCDVGKDSLRKEGLLLKGIYNYDLLFQTHFGIDKPQRLEMCETSMTHCMLIVGVDLDSEGRSVKWKVENSWGADVGKKGYFVMSDEWFDDNVYQLIVPKKYLSEKELQILEQEPVILPIWHPMF